MAYHDYEYTPPIAVKGGIKAASRRGKFGSQWWGQRWAETLDQYYIGARLGRGRSYARQGQVMSIDIQNGAVTARVQGSRKRPYQVKISVQTIGPEDWQKLRQAMANQPVIAASLLSGRMPEAIEDEFKAIGLSMFPNSDGDLETTCNCPDWSNPCKHIAAVYLLLGEEFDRDPFLIFRMRGMDRAELLGSEFRQQAQHIEGPPPTPEPLPATPEDFWTDPTEQLAAIDFGPTASPKLHAALPQQLGRFPFWQAEVDLNAELENIYATASQRAAETLLTAEE